MLFVLVVAAQAALRKEDAAPEGAGSAQQGQVLKVLPALLSAEALRVPVGRARAPSRVQRAAVMQEDTRDDEGQRAAGPARGAAEEAGPAREGDAGGAGRARAPRDGGPSPAEAGREEPLGEPRPQQLRRRPERLADLGWRALRRLPPPSHLRALLTGLWSGGSRAPSRVPGCVRGARSP